MSEEESWKVNTPPKAHRIVTDFRTNRPGYLDRREKAEKIKQMKQELVAGVYQRNASKRNRPKLPRRLYSRPCH